MKTRFNLLWVILVIFSPALLAQNDLSQRLKNHVTILASDSLEGRGLGTQGRIRAMNYIAAQFQQAGLNPYQEGTYFQLFDLRIQLVNVQGNNVVGWVEGSHPDLKNEYIVVGAHYDHLGYATKNGEKIIYPGADDNASGTATVMELAGLFAANPSMAGRSIIFVAFDAEESGLLGAKRFLEENTVFDISKIKLMFSLDMVGMYEASGKVDMRGSGSLQKGADIVKKVAAARGINLGSTAPDISQYTDTGPFGDVGIPSVHVFTGMKSPYHKPEDTHEKLDYEGMALVTGFLQDLIAEFSVMPELVPAMNLVATEKPGALRFSWGLTANFGSARHRYPDEFYKAKGVFGVGAGLFFQTHLGKILTFQPEVLYDYDGSQAAEGLFGRHNLLIPANVQFNLPLESGGAMRAYPFAGGYFRYTFAGINDNDGLDFDHQYNDQEWGINYGIGLEVMRFSTAVTFRRGLTNISKKGDDNFRSSGTYFTVGYRF